MNRANGKGPLLATLFGAAFSLCGAALLHSGLRPAGEAAAAAETPWVRYVMVGLGGFRGVVSEVLWMRASRLQEQGRYLELVQLSDWINALDPRATDAWAFSAWNLAYNISAMFHDAPSRLRWVEAGVSLLRDRAIPANPDSARLCRELGWLYQNKIGGSEDSANAAYKLALARAVSEPEGMRPLHGGLAPLSTGLDPSVVADIEGRFGRLDWRLPQAHSIYWAWKGLGLAPDAFDEAGLKRMVHQNLVTLIGAGRFTGDLEAGVWRTEPDFSLVRPTMAYFEENATTDGEQAVYGAFLKALLPRLDAAGQKELAALCAEKIKALGGH